MSGSVVIVEEIKRIGFRFQPAIVRATVPPGAIGTYCLLSSHTPVYVGRSDHCVLTRLAAHHLAGVATHFMWQPSSGAWEAFCLEAYWWHRMAGVPSIRNMIHPARPAGDHRACPFCDARDMAALRRLLPWTRSEPPDPGRHSTH